MICSQKQHKPKAMNQGIAEITVQISITEMDIWK